MQQLMPFLVLLIVAVIVNHIPMADPFKLICNIVFGVVALVMVVRFAGLV